MVNTTHIEPFQVVITGEKISDENGNFTLNTKGIDYTQSISISDIDSMNNDALTNCMMYALAKHILDSEQNIEYSIEYFKSAIEYCDKIKKG